MSENLLVYETSPYLRQHMDNPVHWRPWGEDALAEARLQNKPILLSVGYAACHWCHVMAHESFEDQNIARLMNALFINIKVDREERPDVDTIYQSALALMGQQGGWPLTMFLTPDGHPFWGGTYFPPTPRYGRPAFSDVLQAVADAYYSQPDRVESNVAALRKGLSQLANPTPGQGFSPELFKAAADQALRLVDPVRGGTVGAPKFPQPVFFRFLWRNYRRTKEVSYRHAVVVTLDSLALGGIYDHLAGGFARYSTDEEWLVPHFEKMLYDNALLVDLFAEVWLETRSPLYLARIRETISWMLRDLRIDDSASGHFALASAFDADSEGVEGKYYLWTEAEIDSLLGADAAVFKLAYDVTPAGNWEGHTILNRRASRSAYSDKIETTIDRCRRTLKTARDKRVPPSRDDKVLADWNGLAITALVQAAMACNEPDWLEAARSIFAFVARAMQPDGRLRHVWSAGSPRHPAILDDYANMARAALALYEATSEKAYLTQAENWVATANRHYWDDNGGGYFLSADDTTDVITRSKTIFDNAVPAGNGTMVDVLARLFHLTGISAYRDRADATCRLFSGNNPQYLMGIPGLLMAADLLENAVHVVIAATPGDASVATLTRTVAEAPISNKILSVVSPGENLPKTHPAHGKAPVGGQTAAYVCVASTCSPPFTNAALLRDRLASL
jgi:hypothetical protein